MIAVAIVNYECNNFLGRCSHDDVNGFDAI